MFMFHEFPRGRCHRGFRFHPHGCHRGRGWGCHGPNFFRGPHCPGSFAKGGHWNKKQEGTELQDWGGEYRLVRWLPGLDAGAVHVQIKGNELVVRTESDNPDLQFECEVAIPADVDREFIMAELKNGLLTVILPKSEPRNIPVVSVESDMDKEEDRPCQSAPAYTEPAPVLVEWQLENWGSDYRVVRPAPGLSPEDLVIDIQGRRVVVTNTSGQQDLNGAFELPEDTDEEFMLADVEDGVLTIVLPKTEVQARKVPVTESVLEESDEGGPSEKPKEGGTAVRIGKATEAAAKLTIDEEDGNDDVEMGEGGQQEVDGFVDVKKSQ